ncbi:MAG: TonB-dependent receptor [Bacteroidales bacterium]|nr:TonB-dependent receptor [Bacteroidales bacterium]
MKKRIFTTLSCLYIAVAATMAQKPQTVTGTIVDELGDPLTGAAVRLAGSRIGTVTDIDGNFSLTLPPAKEGENQKLEFSYLGYVPQSVAVNGEVYKIKLNPDDKNLEEVVVVGYGTQKAKNVTGAIESITPEYFKDLNVTSLGEALSGMINGLHVSMTGSKPGDPAHLTIRQSTELAKNWGGINAKFSEQDDTPLYIIDDFISSETEFNNLDPSEVESISVLKDASAAIYGAQGAYGVILVKTKRGKVASPKITYNGSVGFTSRLFKPEMMNAQEWARTWNTYKGSLTGEVDDTKTKDYFQKDEIDALRGINYQPLDDEWSAALTHKHAVNVSGGTEKATYFAGVTYNTQDGNVGKLDYNRWNYRAGTSAHIGKWVKADIQISGNTSEKKTPRNRYGSASSDNGDYAILLEHLPFMPISVNGYPIVYNGIEGTGTPSGNQTYNWDAIQSSSDHQRNRSNSFQFNTSLDLDFGFVKYLEGLHAKISYSRTIGNSETNVIATDMDTYTLITRGGSGGHLYIGDDVDYGINNLNKVTLDNGERISRGMSRSDSYQFNFILSYKRQIEDHDFSGLFSVERSESWAETLDGYSSGVPLRFTDGQSNSIMPTEGGDYTNSEWGKTETGRLSFIGRFNYAYQNKYLLEALFRSDASAKFAPKYYWGNFPSVSAGWVMSQEDWFDQDAWHIDFLKVRGSWGLLGRDNVKSYVWYTRYNRDASKGAIFGSNSYTQGINYGMIIEQGGANPDAHWDKTYKTNFGIDAKVLDSRLSINYDFYYDMGREIFSTYQGTKGYPQTLGIQATPENFAEINEWGHELSLGWRDKIADEVNYWVKVSTGYSDNKVLKCAPIANPDRDDLVKDMRKDHGLWGLNCVGMFKSYQDINEYFAQWSSQTGVAESDLSYMGMTKDAVRPGMLIYKDMNGAWNAETKSYDKKPDGKVDASDDMVQLSKFSSNPYGATFNFGASWKGLSLQCQLGASWGAYTCVPSTVRKSYSALTSQYGNIPKFWKDMFVYEDIYDASGNIVVPQNLNSDLPNIKYSINSNESTYWRISAAQMSINNLSLGYTLPKSLLKKTDLSSCRLNITCQNVARIFGPEYKDAWSNWGGNYGYYPNLRKVTIGLNVSF